MGANGSFLGKDTTIGEPLIIKNTIWDSINHCVKYDLRDNKRVPIKNYLIFSKKFNSKDSLHESCSNAVKNLKILRHPNILEYVHSTVTKNQLYLVTESAVNLNSIYNTLSNFDILAGLHHILEGLIFLEKTANMRHNSISLDSIFVLPCGRWVLGNFEQASVINDQQNNDIKAYGDLLQHFLITVTKIIDAKSNQLMEDLIYTLKDESSIRFTQIYEKYQEAFNNKYLYIYEFIKHLPMKTFSQKEEFFTTLVHDLKALPNQLIAERYVDLLFEPTMWVEPLADEYLFPQYFEILEKGGIYNRENFKAFLVPAIIKQFEITEIGRRLILLKYFPTYARYIDAALIQELLLPKILIGLQDERVEIVSATYLCMSFLVTLLPPRVVTGIRPRRAFVDGRLKPAHLLPLSFFPKDVDQDEISNVQEDVKTDSEEFDQSSALETKSDNVSDGVINSISALQSKYSTPSPAKKINIVEDIDYFHDMEPDVKDALTLEEILAERAAAEGKSILPPAKTKTIPAKFTLTATNDSADVGSDSAWLSDSEDLIINIWKQLFASLNRVTEKLSPDESVRYITETVIKDAPDQKTRTERYGECCGVYLYVNIVNHEHRSKWKEMFLLLAAKDMEWYNALASTMNMLIMEYFHWLSNDCRFELLSICETVMVPGKPEKAIVCLITFLSQLNSGDVDRGKDNANFAREYCSMLLKHQSAEIFDINPSTHFTNILVLVLSRLVTEVAKENTLEELMKMPILQLLQFCLTANILNCVYFGRDLILCLNKISKIPIFAAIQKDILASIENPPKPIYKDFTRIYSTLTPLQVNFYRISFNLYKKVRFLMTHMPPTELSEKHLEMFTSGSLMSKDYLSIKCELVRYVSAVDNNLKEALPQRRKDFILFIFSTLKDPFEFKQIVHYLIYDLLFTFEDSPAVCPVFPVIFQVLVHLQLQGDQNVIGGIWDTIFSIANSFKEPSYCYKSLATQLMKCNDPKNPGLPQAFFENGRYDMKLKNLIYQHFNSFIPLTNPGSILPNKTAINLMMKGESTNPRHVIKAKTLSTIDKKLVSASIAADNGLKKNILSRSLQPTNMFFNNGNKKEKPIGSIEEAKNSLFALDDKKNNGKEENNTTSGDESDEFDTLTNQLPPSLKNLLNEINDVLPGSTQSAGVLMIQLLRVFTECSESDQESHMETFAVSLNKLFTKFFNEKSYLPKKVSKETLQLFFQHPVFVIFRQLYHCLPQDTSRRSLLQLMSVLVEHQKRIGYLLLFFVKEEYAESKSHTGLSIYKDLSKELDIDLEKMLEDDLKNCHFDDYSLFFYLIPFLFNSFQTEVMKSTAIYELIFTYVDPGELTKLSAMILHNDITFFNRSNVPTLALNSFEWPVYARRNLWEMINCEGVPLDWITTSIAKINHLDTVAARGIFLMIRRQEKAPTLGFVRNIMMRPRNDTLAPTMLKLLLEDDDYQGKFIIHVGALLDKAFNASDFFESKDKEASKKVTLDIMYSHIDAFRSTFSGENTTNGTSNEVVDAFFADRQIKKHFSELRTSTKSLKFKAKYSNFLNSISSYLKGCNDDSDGAEEEEISNKRSRTRNGNTSEQKQKRRKVEYEESTDDSD
uniref:Protein kinase domain-containing protein n=1 Tax=Rhabditophanes sp. KR3021 TaxID=114890 RepID=A0AC35TSJ0_9BILA